MAESEKDLAGRSDNPDPANVGRTGYGQWGGELRTMYGGDIKHVTDFPENITKLEKLNWYQHSLRTDYPKFVLSPEENRRVWQDMEVERMLDHHPTHEIHPNDLPDYHYWPMIQNEVNHKPKLETITTFEHTQDATDVPRFFKTGVPKTPLQEQDFHIPLTEDGKFDWRENIRKNGYTASIFSKIGWDKRFHVPINRPMLPFNVVSIRQFATLPIHFRQFELPFQTRGIRHISASVVDRHAWFAGLYLAGLMYLATKDGHYKTLNWDNEPWNYDMTFVMNNRNKGGFHGVV